MNILNSLQNNALMRKLLPRGFLQPKPDDEANKVKSGVIHAMKAGDTSEMMKCTIKMCSEEEVRAEEEMKMQVSTEHAQEATSIDKQLRGNDGSNSDTKMDYDSGVSESPVVDTVRDGKRLAAKENQEFSRFQQQVLTMRIRKRRHHGKPEHVEKSRFAGKEVMPRAPNVGPSKRMKITQPVKKTMLM